MIKGGNLESCNCERIPLKANKGFVALFDSVRYMHTNLHMRCTCFKGMVIS